MIIVVDASVAAMWYLPQTFSGKAIGLLGSGHDLVAPELMRLEVGSALLRAMRRKELTREESVEVIVSLLPEAVRFMPASNEQDAASLKLAIEHGGSIYDAVYIALARSLDAPIATNDGEMTVIARKAEVRASLIGEGPPLPPQQEA